MARALTFRAPLLARLKRNMYVYSESGASSENNAVNELKRVAR